MDVRLLDDVALFAHIADGFLRRERLSANVIATNVQAIRQGLRPSPVGAAWVVAEDAGNVQGVAMHTPPFALFLPRLEVPVIDALAQALAESGRALPGVNGELSSVARFAECWTTRTGQSSRRRTSMRMYVLAALRPPIGVPGRARNARVSEAELVAGWLSAFHEEATPGDPSDDFAAVAARRIAQGGLCLWIDGDVPVSLAGYSPAAAGVSRVGPVYTPPDQRRRGYGAAVTAAASRAAIDAGAVDVALYTDLSNPVSNSIYQAIGYVPDHDAEERDFV